MGKKNEGQQEFAGEADMQMRRKNNTVMVDQNIGGAATTDQ